MNHKPFGNWMQLALDDALPPEQRRELDAHLADCPDCQAHWGGLQAAERLLRAAPLAAPRAGFGGRFQARLAQRRSRPRLLGGALALALAAAALAAVILPGGAALLFTGVRAAQQPAAGAALLTGLNAGAEVLGSVGGALLLAARAVALWAAGQPVLWLGLIFSALLGLTASSAWLWMMRKLLVEVWR